ncbi:hypothetical protein ACNQKP_16205 [Bdellovibrio bacteriovorus]|uniref:hypothetical protein n=1 Tax=Bdellovibrio bacteriovorus TaxID=959 RepID=UPI003AA9717C
MIRHLLIFTFIFGLIAAAEAQNKKTLYSCQLQDEWLQAKSLSAGINIEDLDHATITIKSESETVVCPMAVETVQDASRSRIARIIFSMTPSGCSPQEKLFHRNLRRRVELFIDAHPDAKGSAQLSWRHRGARSECKETVNNLKALGIGNKFHPTATTPSRNASGTR